MNVFGTGIDLVELKRIQESIDRFGEKFINRVFTKKEQAYCDKHKRSAPHYAARFAAKEAVSKAFGTGIGKDVSFLDIEVVKKASGAPAIQLHGAGANFAKKHRIAEIHLSLTHSEHYAVAHALTLC